VIGPACWLLFLTALASPVSGQTVVPRDTTRRVGGDTTRPPADSAARPRADSLRASPGDTARPVRADSAARASADTARPAANDSARRSTPSAEAAPVISDSVLAAACAQGGSLAANLLVVLFVPTVADSDRVALAKAVGGTLAGPADAVRAGGYYLQLPNADLDPTVADRVIRYPTVQEVGPVSCPSR
jgi:hypothetical protein